MSLLSTFTDAASATFSGNNNIQYELKSGTTLGNTGTVFRRQTTTQSFLELEVSLTFRTNKNSGTILTMVGRNDHATLQVSVNYSVCIIRVYMKLWNVGY